METGDFAEAFWKQLSDTGRGREGIFRYHAKAGTRPGGAGNLGRASTIFGHRYRKFPARNDVYYWRFTSDSRNVQLWHTARVASLVDSYGARQAGRRMVEP